MPKDKQKKQKKISKHKRVNDILLGPLERPALIWLAAHMPQWVSPDLLTLIGFIAALLIALSYWLTNFNKNYLWLANFGFVLNWFGDSLDADCGWRGAVAIRNFLFNCHQRGQKTQSQRSQEVVEENEESEKRLATLYLRFFQHF